MRPRTDRNLCAHPRERTLSSMYSSSGTEASLRIGSALIAAALRVISDPVWVRQSPVAPKRESFFTVEVGMEKNSAVSSPSRRDLLRMIGVTAGSTAMYQAMSSLGFAAESPYRDPMDLQGTPKGASVLILGAGMAGMSAAFELRNAGYTVQVLEYNGRAGGRNWTWRGGDRYTELGGATQECRFDKDLYVNPGPWR